MAAAMLVPSASAASHCTNRDDNDGDDESLAVLFLFLSLSSLCDDCGEKRYEAGMFSGVLFRFDLVLDQEVVAAHVVVVGGERVEVVMIMIEWIIGRLL